jgi:peptidoglycan/LPS O-acetylase OafA/YrhL
MESNTLLPGYTPEKKRHQLNLFGSFIRFLYALLPSTVPWPFSQGYKRNTFIGQAHETSYVDGLRGLAAWMVFNTHLSPILSRELGAGWGHGPDSHRILQLPFICVIHAGGYAVHFFYIISGLVASLAAVKAMDKRTLDPASNMQRMSSAIIRRPLRLFLPSFISTLIPFILIRLDAFRRVDAAKDTDLITGWPALQAWPEKAPSCFIQFFHLINENLRMLRAIGEGSDHDYVNKYNPVLWTIPVDFQCSMILLLGFMALYYTERKARLALLILGIVINITIGQIYVAEFFSGWVLAEVRSITTAAKEAEKGSSPQTSTLRSVGNCLGLIVALYLGSFPRYDPQNTTGFKIMDALTPPAVELHADFWHMIASVGLIYFVDEIKTISNFFSLPFARYLGRISFSLYLTHFSIVQLVGTLLYSYIWSITGRSDRLLEGLGFLVGYAILFALVVWIADLFFRFVETPCSKLTPRMHALISNRHTSR